MSEMPELFQRLPGNVIRIFSGRNLLFHGLAIVLTILIVETGLDWTYYVSTRSEWIAHLALPAIILGTMIPILGTLAILAFGELNKNRSLVSTAWVLGQSALLGYLVSISYKAWTGRIPPPLEALECQPKT